VRIEPRATVVHYELASEEEPPGTLGELHESLGRDPQAAAAERTAERILAEARAQRESILAGLQTEAKQARESMEQELATLQQAAELELVEQRAQLVESLRAELDAQYRQRYGAALTQLEQAAAQLAQRQAEYVKEIEQPALELVLAIARQLLAGELAHSPQALARLIAEALALLQPQQSASLLLSPQTLELLTADGLLGAVLAERGMSLERVALEPSPALRDDQFELRAGASRISFDLTAKAAELAEQLTRRAAAEAAAGAGA
jgi:hypothetical protein